MILHTGIALGATLVVLAGALAVLQYREKVCQRSSFNRSGEIFHSFQVEDDRERKVQAQAFHYDAL